MYLFQNLSTNYFKIRKLESILIFYLFINILFQSEESPPLSKQSPFTPTPLFLEKIKNLVTKLEEVNPPFVKMRGLKNTGLFLIQMALWNSTTGNCAPMQARKQPVCGRTFDSEEQISSSFQANYDSCGSTGKDTVSSKSHRKIQKGSEWKDQSFPLPILLIFFVCRLH